MIAEMRCEEQSMLESRVRSRATAPAGVASAPLRRPFLDCPDLWKTEKIIGKIPCINGPLPAKPLYSHRPEA
jgi:hypothetical protein